ncbi:MAG: hypothetical protein ACOVP4_11075 [Bacteriovoracaceae bacterium]
MIKKFALFILLTNYSQLSWAQSCPIEESSATCETSADKNVKNFSLSISQVIGQTLPKEAICYGGIDNGCGVLELNIGKICDCIDQSKEKETITTTYEDSSVVPELVNSRRLHISTQKTEEILSQEDTTNVSAEQFQTYQNEELKSKKKIRELDSMGYCLSDKRLLRNKEIPPREVLTFIKQFGKSKNGPSIVSILETNQSSSKALNLFLKLNPFWSHKIQTAINDQEKRKVADQFLEIYQSSPHNMGNYLRELKSTEDYIALNEKIKKKKESDDSRVWGSESDKGLIEKAPYLFFENPDLLSKTYENQNKSSPNSCRSTYNAYMGIPDVSLVGNYSRISSAIMVGACKKSYDKICYDYRKSTDTNQELSESEKQLIKEALSDYQNEQDYEAIIKLDLLAYQKEICTKSHKLKSPFKKNITYKEFRDDVCNFKTKIKNFENRKISEACMTDEAFGVLGDLYVAHIDDDSIGKSIEAYKVNASINLTPETLAKDLALSKLKADVNQAGLSKSDNCGPLCTFSNMLGQRKSSSSVVSLNNQSSTPSFVDGLASGMTKAATTMSGPAVESNIQSYMNGMVPITSVLPADLNNADPGQLSHAKRSVDNGISELEKRLDNYEKKEEKSYSASQNQEISLLKKQIEELRQQSELLKSQLDKEKEVKVADKSVESPTAVAGSRSPASTGDYKSSLPHVSSATQQAANNQNLQPSKIFENSYSDGSFHNVPTLGSSKSIDSKAFNSRSSNDALLSIYTDKTVSSLVDAVATSSNSNILVVGNALEMQEATVKDKKFQTKEIVIDQIRLEQVRSNPESLKNLIEENKIKNHVGILTLKTGESQLNYIMRKDDSGKLVILPLNIARKVTLDSLKNELISH